MAYNSLNIACSQNTAACLKQKVFGDLSPPSHVQWPKSFIILPM